MTAITLSLDQRKKSDKLTSFLYLLLRDRLTFGECELILAELQDCTLPGPNTPVMAYVGYLRKAIEC